jgi:GNAT superfamily N-acetyltransferase
VCATIYYVRPRRAHLDEGRALADVWLRSRAASMPAIPAPVHTEDEVRAYFCEVVLPTKEVWVAEKGGAVVALLVLGDEWIDQLYVDPEFVGDGLGSSLIAVAKATRPGGLKLWTFAANTRAMRFYERHGFVATGTTTGDNEEGAPDVRYEWRP